jgi:hypothetical protein
MKMRDRDTHHDPDDPHWAPESPPPPPGRGPDDDPAAPPTEDDCED